ncbi:glycosyltransferase involved in cell wall biosynthesis [Arcticibacter pallidicorallinus]|uniref:Glycosyltransferase involved in cell wall biosynthesis n=1 Tax=Arcticibacter pallidicorallinus TaxID=1259464 RepID=A0A2T0U6X6_9SPHI|nr:glycosyltransferase family 4 protein [Arcticibacter pallidicorallinus]PRY53664.1 glycosyltransferase involved in cell wall biosynthesis [Arcticibacter pallidicorallinus]
MKNILFVSCTKFIGGGEIFLLGIEKALRSTAHLHFYVASPHLYNKLSTTRKSLFKSENLLKNSVEINRYVSANSVDLVVLNGNRAIYLAPFMKAHAVAYKHTGSFSVNGILKKLIYYLCINLSYSFCKKIVYVSKAISKDDVLWKAKRCIIYNGIDISRYDGSRRSDSIVTITFIGRLVKDKGILEAVKVVESVSKVKDIRFRIVGDGPLLEDLQNYVVSNESDFISIEGYIENPEQVLQSTDIFFLPTYYESFGLSVCEAMAMKIPVITSNVGGLPEIIRHGFNGFLFPPADLESFRDTIIQLIDDPNLAKMVGDNARDTIRERFSNKETGRALAQLITTLT